MRFMLSATPVLLGSLFIALPSVASAQDADPDFFNGVYVSGHIGANDIDDRSGDGIRFDTDGDGDFNDTVRTVAGANAFSTGFCSGLPNSERAASGCTGDDTDLGYGARIGFDQRINGGPLVAGLLVEGEMSDSRDLTTGFSTTPANYVISRGIDKSAAVRGRIGYSPGDGRGLFYVTGGLAYADLEHDFFTTNGANAFAEENDDKWQLGGQVGGGAELMVTNNFSIGLEYLYSRFDDDDYQVRVTQGTAGDTNPFIQVSDSTVIRNRDQDLITHSIRATVGFHF